MAGDNIGVLQRLRSFARYWGSNNGQWYDHLYTAFPGSEANLHLYSLENSDYFYLYNNNRPYGTTAVVRYFKSSASSSCGAYFASDGNLVITGVGQCTVQLNYGWNDNPRYAGTALGTFCVAGGCFTQSGRSGGGNFTTHMVQAGQTYQKSTWGGQQNWTSHGTYICFRDGHGGDCNAWISIGTITNYNYTMNDHAFSIYGYPAFGGSGFSYEGIVGYGWTSGGANRQPVYEYYSTYHTDHYYTVNYEGSVTGGHWHYHGIAFYAPLPIVGCTDSQADTYNSNADTHAQSMCVYSGCTDPNAYNYSSIAQIDDGSCLYYDASVSISVNPTHILQGESSQLSWSSGYASSASINQGIGTVAANQSGSTTISPYDDTNYTLTAINYGGASFSDNAYLTVYEPVSVTISCAATNNTIVRGQSTTLTWIASGDVVSSNLQPVGGAVANSTSGYTITPTVDTTYTITNYGYLGSTSTASVTVTVLQPPEANVSSDMSVNYNQNVNVNYSTVNAVQVTMIVNYDYVDGSQSVTNEVLTNHSGSLVITPPYNTVGPSQVTITIAVQGYGSLSATAQSTTTINIDTMPDTIVIPASDDLLFAENPVISPDSTVTTDEIQVTDIDIPVEIKANQPIEVDVNDQGVYLGVREI